jgi:ribosome-binding factor A
MDKIVAALNRAAGYFRRELGAELDLRYTPQLSFRADESFAEADRIEKILKQENVRRDLEKK